VRVALGLLLVTAAALKLFGLNVTAIPRAGWFATPQVQVIAAEWELILGFWLLSGAWPFAAWVMALATFTSFATISAYFGYIGIASCGCFGVIRTGPWTLFAIDVAAIALLFVSRPPTPTMPSLRFAVARTSLRQAAIPIGALCILLAITAIGWWIYGSPNAALARLNGQVLSVAPEHIDFGTAKPGEVIERTIAVINWTDQPIRLIGGQSDCWSVTNVKIPTEIGPGAVVELPILARVPNSVTGALTGRAEFWTDHRTRRAISFTIACRVE
jgi:hypothetical protein